MRKLYCDCGTLVASLESGSKIQKGAIILCNKCSCKNDGFDDYISEGKTDSTNFENSLFGDGEVLDNLRSMFGMK